MADDTHNHPQDCNCPHPHHGDTDPDLDAGLDPGNQALSDALRISFGVLKLIMFGVVILFIWSGFFKVEQNQNALILRFGKVLGSATESILEPGWHWKWPDPIDEVVYFPVQEQIMPITSFWYYQDEREKAGGRAGYVGKTLQITKDGYSLCASQSSQNQALTDGTSAMIDYNLVHTQWKLRYVIDNPRAFFDHLWDGRQDHYYNVNRFLQSALESSIIQISASHDISWMLWREDKSLSSMVLDNLRRRLAPLAVGIRINALDLVGRTVPRQVQSAFDAAAQADNEASKLTKDASAKADEIINQARAQASIALAESQAYKTRIVQAAEADSNSLQIILKQINQAVDQKLSGQNSDPQKRQQLFNELLTINMDQLYQEAVREIVDKADEVIVPSTAGEDTEWRVYLSRDASLKPRTQQEDSADSELAQTPKGQ